jgi:hypothetical protein
MDAHNQGYLAWTWDTWGCSANGGLALITDYAGTPSQPYGQDYHDHLAALTGAPTATPTFSATATRTSTASPTASATATAMPTSTPQPTVTSTPQPTSTRTATATSAPVNLARLASASASSENSSTSQTADKAIDGVIDGYPGDYTKEWATVWGGAGSWLKLSWASPQTVSRIVLYDRPNGNDQITSGTLQFNDGSSVTVGPLNNDGTGVTVLVGSKTITSVQLNITSVAPTTQNIGLAEIQVYAN